MDTEMKKLLQKNLAVSEELLGEVHKLRRSFFWQRIFKLIKWAIIIGLLIFGFIQLQPYLDMLINLYQNLGVSLNQLQQFSGQLPQNFQQILQQ